MIKKQTLYNKKIYIILLINIILFLIVLRFIDFLLLFVCNFCFSSIKKINQWNIKNNIKERNNIEIVLTIPVVSVYINNKIFIYDDSSLIKISHCIDQKTQKIYNLLKSNNDFIWLKKYITPIEQKKLYNLKVEGIFFIKEHKRVYPYQNLLSHTIGFVNDDGWGMGGLENYYNTYLLDNKTKSLYTSLDINIQQIVHKELYNSIHAYQAQGGSALIMNVRNGEIISCVNIPDFNPNNKNYINNINFFNKATLGLYELGSIFKILSLAIAIDVEKIYIKERFDVARITKIGWYDLKDYRREIKTILSIPEIIVFSSNIGILHIVRHMGVKKQKMYLKKLKFLSTTKLETIEISYPIFFDQYWYHSNPIGYGHGVAVTLIHFIQAFSSIVNGGIFQYATLIRHGNMQRGKKKVFRYYTSIIINQVLRLTTNIGFAKRAAIKDYFIGAKTGTAEKVKKHKYNKNKNISVCIGVFPTTYPIYSILILIDEAKRNKNNRNRLTGGVIAAPIIPKIVKKLYC